MVLANKDFPPDIRVEKEARMLRAAGYDVVVLCHHGGQRPLEDEWEGCKIIRVPRLPFLLGKTINTLFYVIPFRHWQWDRVISRVISAEKVDALHVHDLPMLGTVLPIGRRHRVPVIADLHENYPAMLQEGYQEQGLFWRERILASLCNPSTWEACERRWTKEVDHLFVVVDEAKERFIREGIAADRVTAVENTEDAAYFTRISLDKDLIGQYYDDFVLSYVGGFEGQHRGLTTVIEAMPQILCAIPNARLLLIGSGRMQPTLENMVAERSLGSRVTFFPWQPFEKIPTFLALSAVCLVPYHSSPHTETTIPHKLFQYMLMGKPVVVSTCRPLRRIVEETGAGLVFQDKDHESLAQAVIRLKDESLRRELGEAGRRAALGKYSWRETSKKLLNVYERLGQRSHV